jgi:hypothetical protein
MSRSRALNSMEQTPTTRKSLFLLGDLVDIDQAGHQAPDAMHTKSSQVGLQLGPVGSIERPHIDVR